MLARATCLLATFLFINFSMIAQLQLEWNQTIGHSDIDYGQAIAVAADGSVYSAGGKHSSGNQQTAFYLVKYSSNGQYLWSASYLGWDISDEILQSIVLDNTGNVYVAGYCQIGSGSSWLVVLKFDSLGNQLWVNLFPGVTNTQNASFNRSHLAIDTIYGRVYVAGTYASTATVSSIDIFTGLVNWTNISYPVAANVPQGIFVNSYHQIIVAGSSNYDFSSNNIYAVTTRYDTSGSIIWQRQYSAIGFQHAFANNLANDHNDNIIIAGCVQTSTTQQLVTLKYDTAGILKWERFFAVPSNHGFGKDVAISPAGNYYVSGYEEIPSPLSRNPVIIDYDTSGNVIFSDIYPISPGDLAGNEIEINAAGEIYITNGVKIIKYSSSGQFQWLTVFSYGYCFSDLCLDNYGNLFVTGYYFVNGIDYDFSTSKYSDSTSFSITQNISPQTPQVHLFPNPSNSKISIELPVSHGNYELKIISSFGKEIMNFSIENSQAIDVSFFDAGFYIFEFFEDGNFLTCKAVVIN